MPQFLLLCLILADSFVVLAMAHGNASNPPVPSPLKAEAPIIRKLGKQQPKVLVKSFGAPNLSPSEAPQAEDKKHSTKQEKSSLDQAAFMKPKMEKNLSVEEKEMQLKKHHRSIDKSVAGGGVILGGLATTFLVAVFCYIRATGRSKTQITA